ncbi:MAG: hypothetical protein PHI85_04010 [Victivallaceae bacterium]|nr:hypothetical protein [Victivallaceae bacterium]
MSDYTVVGTAVLGFGGVDLLWGLCESVTAGQESDKLVVNNGANAVVAVVYSNFRTKVSAKYTPLAAFGSATEITSGFLIGKELNVPMSDGRYLKIIIDGATLETSKGGVNTFSVDGYAYPKINAQADGFGVAGASGGIVPEV